MNERGMVIAFVNFTLLVLGVMPIISGLTHGNNIKVVGLANIQFGIAILVLLFIANVYFYRTSGSQAVGKHFAKYWLLYGFFGGLATAVTVLFLAAYSFGFLELFTVLAATAVGCYCLGAYHAICIIYERMAQLLKNTRSSFAPSAEEIVHYLKYGRFDRS